VGGREQGAEEIFRAKKAKVAEALKKFYGFHGLCISIDIICMFNKER
jgi:Mn-dependent DtxR family transcriptional regulator